jgi:hypothetical protein
MIPQVVPEESNIENTVPTENQRIESIISTVTYKSDSPANNLAQPIGTRTYKTSEKSGQLIEEAEIYDWGNVEQAASFSGGMEALSRFMQKHLEDPRNNESDPETGTVRVQVRFIVNKEGCATQFAIVTSGGKRFDDEVIRVLKKMPK